MKIKETYVGFTGEIVVGRYCIFIVLDKQGVQVSEDELVEKAGTFEYVVIESIDEVFEQKEDVAKFIKKLKKANNDIVIEIRTKALIKPNGITDFKNIMFIVHLQLKNSGLPYNKRIIIQALQWFITNNGYFVFNVNNEDELDEANTLISSFEIKKHQVYLSSVNGVDEFIFNKAKLLGYNIMPKL